MAIYNTVPTAPEYTNSNTTTPPSQPQQATPQPTTSTPVTKDAVDIDAWTMSALQSLSVPPVAGGTGTPLVIPIDEATATKATVTFVEDDNSVPKRPLSRRDSQKTREASLKGREGSRQRRRWENDRLVGVPNAQPPLPSDWEVHPTHPTHRVHYQLAHFWEQGVRQRAEDRTARLAAARKEQQRSRGTATGLRHGEVSRDLRESAKRIPAVAAWIRSLEGPVRTFLQEQSAVDDCGMDRSDSDEWEEIVFTGRQLSVKTRSARREVDKKTVEEGMVFDLFGDDESAAFKRWLAHSISDYYGLESRSVKLHDPSRKAVYIGLKKQDKEIMRQVPRPLWEICC